MRNAFRVDPFRVLYLVACVSFSIVFALRCATVRKADPEIERSLKEVCSLYQTHRDDVIAIRAYAIANKSSVPPEVWAKIEKLGHILPVLDAAGRKSCDYAELAAALSLEEVNGWRDALKFVVEVAIPIARQAGVL
jgi:hypothetical protein